MWWHLLIVRSVKYPARGDSYYNRLKDVGSPKSRDCFKMSVPLKLWCKDWLVLIPSYLARSTSPRYNSSSRKRLFQCVVAKDLHQLLKQHIILFFVHILICRATLITGKCCTSLEIHQFQYRILRPLGKSYYCGQWRFS